ncbi:MAG TPA: HAD family hydrolase [Chthoniobacterales bacterium]
MNSPRAVIFDVYHTIVDVLPSPPDAATRWRELASTIPGLANVPSLEDVSARCREIVDSDHAIARERGIRFPEVLWPHVMLRALPELAAFHDRELADFLCDHIRLLRETALADGVANFLRGCHVRGWALGIASNAQAYTLRELEQGLGSAGLTPGIFEADLMMWSFRNGFSKPDPHVFQILAARLAARGIAPGEILMIGDRFENDIEPARAFGWQTALIGPTGTNWRELEVRLFGEP